MEPYNPFSLVGKTVLVTGASSGIGQATAKECVRLGATVVATGRNAGRLAELTEVTAIAADLTDEASVEQLVAQLPKLDGVVLCAGVNNEFPVQVASRKKVDSVMETNFFAQIGLLRMLLKKKVLNDGTSVVALSSIGGMEDFTPGQAAYGASKAALLSWMKYAAKELAPRRIRVNCICPGHIVTPMNEKLAHSPEKTAAYEQAIPLQRFGQPEEIAYGIVYLLSEASAWVTGTALKIDGGPPL
jgi:NAD(P)-dependent dehydrogenase (short-subunit alcohol dehydrogenase family)